MKTATTPATYRQVRPDLFEIFRDGKRIGALSQVHVNALRNAGRWIFWEEGKASSPPFRTLEEAKQHIG